MTTMAAPPNGTSPMYGPSGDRSSGAGVRAMATMTAAEKTDRHARLLRFLDDTDYSNMSVRQIAEAVGISQQPVRNELRVREGLRKPGRKPGVPQSQAELARRRRRRLTRQPLEADQVLTGWLAENPGVHSAPEIERATGIPHSTMRDALQRLGVATVPHGQHQPAPSPGTAANPVDLDYVSKIADGSLVAIDKATGLLWVMKPDHLL